MLTFLKSGCALLFAGLLFSSCYPTSLYNQTRYAVNDGDKPAQADKKNVFHNDVPVCSMGQLLKRFPAAENISWQKSSAAGWVAGFTAGQAKIIMNFDANGDWVRIYNRFAEAPDEVRKAVTGAFNSYQITSVYSVVTIADETHPDYSIVIRNKEHCKVVELCNGNLSVFTAMDGIQ